MSSSKLSDSPAKMGKTNAKPTLQNGGCRSRTTRSWFQVTMVTRAVHANSANLAGGNWRRKSFLTQALINLRLAFIWDTWDFRKGGRWKKIEIFWFFKVAHELNFALTKHYFTRRHHYTVVHPLGIKPEALAGHFFARWHAQRWSLFLRGQLLSRIILISYSLKKAMPIFYGGAGTRRLLGMDNPANEGLLRTQHW